MGMMRKLLGTNSKREVKKITPIVDKIEALSDEYKALTDEQLRAKTDEFKARLAAGATLDDILPEAFATCRDVYKRQESGRSEIGLCYWQRDAPPANLQGQKKLGGR